MPCFTIDVRHLDGEAIVRLVGELDIAGVAQLKQVVRPLLARYDADQLVFDLEDLELLDAAGLGGLVHTLRNRPGDLRPRLRNVRPLVGRVLEVTECERLFDTGAELAV